MSTPEQKRKVSSSLGKWAVGVSLIYLIGLATLTNGRWSQLQTMPLNELGDFLAGAFGPLAILWLVVGFFQQGHELDLNTQALLLQHESMKASVHETAQLVKVAKEEQDATEKRWHEDRARRDAVLFPSFTIVCKHGLQGAKPIEWGFDLGNLGADCSNLELQTDNPDFWLSQRSIGRLKCGETYRVQVGMAESPPSGDAPFSVVATFDSPIGKRSREFKFVLQTKSDGLWLTYMDPLKS